MAGWFVSIHVIGAGVDRSRTQEQGSERPIDRTDDVMDAIEIHAREDGCTFRIVVVPRASRNELAGVMGGAVRLKTVAPPVDGAANAACVRYLAHLFGVPKSNIELVSGEHHKRKTVYIRGMKSADIQRILGEAMK
jgi:uncharacterized protein